MELNENNAELVGAIIRDGNIYRKFNKYRIGFTGNIINDREYFEYLAQLIKKEWNKDAKIVIAGRGLRIVINSKDTCNFLINNLELPYCEGKGEKVVIPVAIAKEWNLCKNAIRGIVDTDGSVFVSKKPRVEKYPAIEIGTTSTNLAIQLKEVLEARGFRVNKIRTAMSKNSVLPINRIALNEKVQLRKWLDEIGFSNPYKLRRAISYLE